MHQNTENQVNLGAEGCCSASLTAVLYSSIVQHLDEQAFQGKMLYFGDRISG